MNSSGSTPENGNVVPSIWCRYDGDVNEEWRLGVTEVERGQVEQVENQEDLSYPEETSHPQHDEAKLEEVVLHSTQ